MPADKGQEWEHCRENSRTGYSKNDSLWSHKRALFQCMYNPLVSTKCHHAGIGDRNGNKNALKALRYYKKFISVGR